MTNSEFLVKSVQSLFLLGLTHGQQAYFCSSFHFPVPVRDSSDPRLALVEWKFAAMVTGSLLSKEAGGGARVGRRSVSTRTRWKNA